MAWPQAIACFFGAAFLTNAVPHLVSGLVGRAFQTPFAKPPGVGLSSSTVNVLWGFANVAAAYVLLVRLGGFDLRSTADAAAAGLGALLMGVLTARLFGRLHGGNAPERP